jgi:hypothetical protein
MRFYNHMPAWEARLALGEHVWSTYLKVTVERNPWEKAMSMYYWRHPEPPRPTLRRFLRRQEKSSIRLGRPPALSNWPIYAIDDEVAVDVVIEYARLASQLEALVGRLGLPGPLTIERAKRLRIPDRRHHREAMGTRELAIVSRVCRREIERFAYQP